ncbi:MAG: hypothetical protein HZC36_00395 [Armatimonadetes bacterium]|nr:hypothetical protein [Armatimonadota bacterium]
MLNLLSAALLLSTANLNYVVRTQDAVLRVNRGASSLDVLWPSGPSVSLPKDLPPNLCIRKDGSTIFVAKTGSRPSWVMFGPGEGWKKTQVVGAIRRAIALANTLYFLEGRTGDGFQEQYWVSQLANGRMRTWKARSYMARGILPAFLAEDGTLYYFDRSNQLHQRRLSVVSKTPLGSDKEPSWVQDEVATSSDKFCTLVVRQSEGHSKLYRVPYRGKAVVLPYRDVSVHTCAGSAKESWLLCRQAGQLGIARVTEKSSSFVRMTISTIANTFITCDEAGACLLVGERGSFKRTAYYFPSEKPLRAFVRSSLIADAAVEDAVALAHGKLFLSNYDGTWKSVRVDGGK